MIGAQMMLPGFAARAQCPAGRERGGIASLLLPGAENAVSLRELAALTGCDERTVRRDIQRERLEGVPILADCRQGYFLPENDAERAACVRSMRHRAQQIWAAADALAAAAIEDGGKL